MKEIQRSNIDIEGVIEEAYEGVNEGSKFLGMSYEEGIISMWSWLTGDQRERPTDPIK